MSKTLVASIVVVAAVAVYGAASLWRSGQQLRAVSATFVGGATAEVAAPEAAPLPRAPVAPSHIAGDDDARADEVDSAFGDSEREVFASVADDERFTPIETAGEQDALALLRTLASDPDPDVRGEAAALIDLYGVEEAELLAVPAEIE